MSNTIVLDPGNTLRIDEIYAFVSRDENGNEGVCAFSTRFGMMPMVAADAARLESLRPIAQDLASKTKKKVHLLKFSTRTEVEEIT